MQTTRAPALSSKTRRPKVTNSNKGKHPERKRCPCHFPFQDKEFSCRHLQSSRGRCRRALQVHPGPDNKITGMMSVAWPSLVILLSELRKACRRPPFQRQKTKKHFTVLFSCTASRNLVSVHSQLLLFGRPIFRAPNGDPGGFSFSRKRPPPACYLTFGATERVQTASLVILYYYLTIGTRL
jgi:hypothetical protein